MLTEADKKWLEERQDKGEYNFYYCQHCNKIPSIVTGGLCAGPCPMYPAGFEYEDAAKFEARVSRVMALYLGAPPCGIGKCDNPNFLCPECRLKHARLAVEAEMEQN